MRPSKNMTTKNKIVTPINEKLNLCPYCYERLPALQSMKKKFQGQAKCPACGRMIKKNRLRTY